VREALQSYVDVQVLALAVAAEALIKTAFPDIVAIDPGLKEDIERFKVLLEGSKVVLEGSDLSPTFKKRITGAAKAFLSPSGSDRLYTFIAKFELDPNIHVAWKDSRHPSVHGEIGELVRQRCS
jgi:hypothetical protein